MVSFAVTGMSCGHCVTAVTSAVGALEGVAGVDVHLVAKATSTVSVTAAGTADLAALRAAVTAAIDDAGYDVVPALP